MDEGGIVIYASWFNQQNAKVKMGSEFEKRDFQTEQSEKFDLEKWVLALHYPLHGY